MNLSVTDLRKNFEISNPATNQEIAKVEKHFGYQFPTDYKEFLLLANGLEGGIDHEYLVLWGTSELIELNLAYQVQDFIQHIIIFGSDGAEEAFAFDTSGPSPFVVKLPFIGMGHIANEKLADSFEEFLVPRVQHKGFIKRLFG
jgi:hypothetical protein